MSKHFCGIPTKEFGKVLKARRLVMRSIAMNKDEWTQVGVAHKLGVDISNYAKWEQGVTGPFHRNNFECVCELFQVDLEYFLKGVLELLDQKKRGKK